MSLLRFELKKLLKQKKYIWVFLITILITSAIFSMNSYQRSRYQGNWAKYTSFAEIGPLTAEWSTRESALIRLQDEKGLNYVQQKQLEQTKKMAESLQLMRITLNFGMGDDYYKFEKSFLDILQEYSNYNGEFFALEGMAREIAIEKNAWVLEHDIPYEFERAPLTQHLFLMETGAILLGIIGIAILLIFFGNSITEEKEHSTWLTLKTQPISLLKLVLAKYTTFLFMVAIFIFMVITVGLVVPLIYHGQTLILQYPKTLITGDSFTIISTWEYMLRSVGLFFCVSSITYSISLLVSKWVNKSLSSYFLVGIVLASGYFSTSAIHSPLNPFYLFNFNEILNGVPQNSPWLFILSAGIWSVFFLMLTVYLPERKIKVGQTIKHSKPFAAGNTKTGAKMLWILRSFEWRKVRREGLLKTFSISIMVIIVAGHFLVSNLTQQRKINYLNELEWRGLGSQVSVYEEYLVGILENLEGIRESDPDEYSYMLSIYSDTINTLEGLIALENQKTQMSGAAIVAYEQGDWNTFHQYQLLINTLAFEMTYPGGSHQGARETIRRFSKQVSIHEKELLMEKNLQPVLSGEFITTIHEYWGRQYRIGWGGQEVRQDEWIRENKKVDNSGLFYLYLSFKDYIYLLPLVLLLFFIGGGMAREKGKKNTFNLLKTQPLSQEDIFMGKCINASVIVLVSTLIIPLMVILVGTVLSRFGDWEYPILHYNSWKTTMTPGYTGFNVGQGYHFITLGKYLIDNTMLFVAFCLFAVAISNFLSVFIKRTLGVFALTLISLAGGYWLNVKTPLQRSHISPFTYFDIPKVVNGEIATTINDPRVNVLTGIIVLLLLSLVIMGTGYVLANREKFIKNINKIRIEVAKKRREKNDTIS